MPALIYTALTAKPVPELFYNREYASAPSKESWRWARHLREQAACLRARRTVAGRTRRCGQALRIELYVGAGSSPWPASSVIFVYLIARRLFTMTSPR
jgi:hypothetical protein